MCTRRWRNGFTLIELLVVVAIIALLISILMPSLQRARQQAQKAACLSNQKNIITACAQYANEDSSGVLIPMHWSQVSRELIGQGFWLERTAMWFSYGGNGTTQPFNTSDPDNGGGEFTLNESLRHPSIESLNWGTAQRPLARSMYPDVDDTAKDLKIFRCPGDRGYPSGYPEGVIDDAPEGCFDTPVYDVIGNSYRASFANFKPSRSAPERMHFGIFGQRFDRLENASRLIAGGDPLFFNFIGTDSNAGYGKIDAPGWHGEPMTDNLFYADGSARPTRAVPKDDESYLPTQEDATSWGVDDRSMLLRGPNWQLDCFSMPGAAVGNISVPSQKERLWPYRGRALYAFID